MQRKNLIVCPAGDNSLHKQWYVSDRSYDIFILYYGDSDPAKALEGTCDFYASGKGLKMELARNILLKHFYQNRSFYSSYEYIWYPDSDIELAPAEVDRMFALAKERNATIFQPSIANHLYPERFNPGSNWGGWSTVYTKPGVRYRKVTHPEAMMPCFTLWAWEHVFLKSLFLFPKYKPGWGIETVWHALSASEDITKPPNHFIFDDIHAFHTVPVGQNKSAVHQLGPEELKYYTNYYLPQIETMVIEEFR